MTVKIYTKTKYKMIKEKRIKRKELELVILPREEEDKITRSDIVKELAEFFYLLYYEE